jgi:CobQ-like glutamine amidotransferase family enzyme
MITDSILAVVLVYPDLLGTYGDRGNAAALLHRARARGLGCRVVEVSVHDALPSSGDIYLIGGGEDAAMLLAWQKLQQDRALVDAVVGGAACFGVCAGYQLMAQEFRGPDDVPREGLGLFDVRCGRMTGPRAVGEVLAESRGIAGIGDLTGFENHQGDAQLGSGVRPLGRLVRGTGNGDQMTEGATQGRVVGSYLHGPALVRNDGLADHLLQLVVGPLEAFDDEPVRRLRCERRAAALGAPRPRRVRGRHRGDGCENGSA